MKSTLAILAMAISVPSMAVAQTPPPYQPSMGDLMVTIVQPRHLKLGLAGQARNWDYADYAQHELEESLDAVLLWERHEHLLAALYVGGSVAGAIAGLALALWVMRTALA